jgi:predicted ABC-type transport system involved in lysophospholipase L1 biosynthesis ATPase subunit
MVLDLLDAARARRGMTLLIASHDRILGDRADRVVRMVDGAIESAGRVPASPQTSEAAQ